MPPQANQSSSLPAGYNLDPPQTSSSGLPTGYSLDTSGPQPIQDSSTIGPAPGLLQRTGQEAKLIGNTAVNSKFPYLHPLDALNAAETQGAGEIEHYAPQRVTEGLLGGQAAGQPYGTKTGLLNNPITPMLLTPEMEALGAGSVVADAYKPVQNAGGISGAYNSAKNAIGNFARNPDTGQLTKGVALGAHAAGAAAGYEAGKSLSGSPYGGYAGAALGGVAGPQIADAFLPSSQKFLENSTVNQLDQGMQDAFKSRMGEIADQEKLRNDQASGMDSGYEPSWVANQKIEAARYQMNNQLAQSRMARQSQQDALDQAANKASQSRMRLERQSQTQQGSVMAADIQQAKDLEATQIQAAAENKARDAQTEQDQIASMEQQLQDQFNQRQGQLSDRAKLNDQWASALNRRGEGASASPYSPTDADNAESESPYSPPSSNPTDLISRTKQIVRPGVEPTAADLKRAGDLTQAPLPRLQALAKFGDKLAQNEINRRLQNP